MKESPKQFVFLVLLTLADWFAILMCVVVIIVLISEPISPLHIRDALFLVAWVALPLLYLAYRYKRYVRLVYCNIGRIIYYSITVLFYASAVVTAFSLLGRMEDSMESFLTAPIGIKPSVEPSGFGSLFPYLLALTTIIGVAYLVARSLRGAKEEYRQLTPTSNSHN